MNNNHTGHYPLLESVIRRLLQNGVPADQLVTEVPKIFIAEHGYPEGWKLPAKVYEQVLAGMPAEPSTETI
jgi:hypothetical protein